jgi:hypothetical protein
MGVMWSDIETLQLHPSYDILTVSTVDDFQIVTAIDLCV